MVINVDDPSRTVDVKYTVQPGAQFPWHSHYGPVIVNIISGSLTYVPAGTCDERTYSSQDEAFVDSRPRSRPHRLQPWHGADGVHRHVLRGTRNAGHCSFRQTLVAGASSELAGKLLFRDGAPGLGGGSAAP